MSLDQIIFLYLLITASASRLSHPRSGLRVKHGIIDTRGKYPNVVALLLADGFRSCTGTLVALQWVLSAGHCFEDPVQMAEYGNMTQRSYFSVSIIRETFAHPGYRPGQMLDNDIGLCRVDPVNMQHFVKISSVDYSSIIGKKVEYAGFGITETDEDYDVKRPLKIGEGIVVACVKTESIGPYICVAPKCSNKNGDSASGDSGGPLFYDGKLVGIVSWGDDVKPVGWYTAVSPFLAWIQNVISNKDGRRKSRGKVHVSSEDNYDSGRD